MQASTDKLRTNGHGPNWRTYAGKRVTIYAADGSYAAKRAPLELREAERAIEALEKLLNPPDSKRDAGGRIEIYLTDPVVDLPANTGGAGTDGAASPPPLLLENVSPEAIVRVVQPEAPGEPVTWPLTRLLVPRW